MASEKALQAFTMSCGPSRPSTTHVESVALYQYLTIFTKFTTRLFDENPDSLNHKSNSITQTNDREPIYDWRQFSSNSGIYLTTKHLEPSGLKTYASCRRAKTIFLRGTTHDTVCGNALHRTRGIPQPWCCKAYFFSDSLTLDDALLLERVSQPTYPRWPISL